MKVTTYVINEGHETQYYGLKNIVNNEILYCGAKKWKTEKGAKNWALKNGYEFIENNEAEKMAQQYKEIANDLLEQMSDEYTSAVSINEEWVLIPNLDLKGEFAKSELIVRNKKTYKSYRVNDISDLTNALVNIM